MATRKKKKGLKRRKERRKYKAENKKLKIGIWNVAGLDNKDAQF